MQPEFPVTVTLYIVGVAAAALLIGIVWMTRPSSRLLLVLMFTFAITASGLLLLSPTPPGYDERADSDRPGPTMHVAGPRVAGLLYALSAGALISLGLTRKSRP